MLTEVKDFNCALDAEEFIGSCLNLLKTLSVAERALLVDWRSKQESTLEQHSFRPEINPISKAILGED